VTLEYFTETMRALAAPDARRVRLDWFGRGSGAKISWRESEKLYAMMTRAAGAVPPTDQPKINVPALLSELEQRTRRRYAEWKAREDAAKKSKQRA